MSEDYDDITEGPISIDRAKHHCGRLAVDCGWRAMEVEMHIDAQAKIIEVLRDEARAWRAAFDEQTGKQIGDASDCRDVALAREATDAILAKHNNRL